MTTNTPQQGGASALVRGRVPSTDLTSLLAFLIEAFPPCPDREGESLGWNAITYDPGKQRLGLNTYGVLRRLLRNRKLREVFSQSRGGGFLRELEIPPKRFTAKLGGRIFNDDLGGVSKHTAELRQLIEAELGRLGVCAGNILVQDPKAALRNLGERTRLKGFLQEQTAHLATLEFSRAERTSQSAQKAVARVLSAQEDIQAEDWLERLADSIAMAQAQRDEEFGDIQRDKLAGTLRQEFDKRDSQVTRFLNFLEDEALARVRLQVGFALMQALAAQVADPPKPEGQAFLAYVRRVVGLFNLYGAPETPHSLSLDLSAAYGFAADFTVSEDLVKVQLYDGLPVWAESNIQLFESRRVDPVSRGVSVSREVSYRFRVNGKDPRNEMRQAFDSRLDRLHKALLPGPDDGEPSPSRVRRSLAEAVFLWLALNPALDESKLRKAAENLAARLNAQGKAGVAALFADLQAWSPAVRGLAGTLVVLLKAKTPKLIAHAQRTVDDLYLVVQQGVVDWVAIERTRGKVLDPLVKPGEGQAETVEWLKHVKVARRPGEVPASLFSIRVRTVLHERTLALRKDGGLALPALRQLPEELLNIVWMPIRVDEDPPPVRREKRVRVEPVWRMGPGVDIWYEPEQLKRRRDSTLCEEDQRQYRAAAVAALTVLVSVFLQVLAARLLKERGRSLPALMLRFQSQGRRASEGEGDPLIYAASQAVESALMRDMPVKMQGLVAEGDEEQWFYKQRGAAFALSSAFPLLLGTGASPALDKIAVLVYATRPCDEHPGRDEADGYLFRAKTYRAEAMEQPFPGYLLSFDRMQSHVVERQDDFKSPKLIVEEVSRLCGLGYKHILLISNHFGNRRINRSAQRHAPHAQTPFLDEVAEKFADASLYTLRRDVFPATRLHRRERFESAFEALGLADHNEFALSYGDGVLKQFIPAFTFATLAIVGGDEAGRPQSGFCTYFLDADLQVRNVEWREQVRANLLNAGPVRACLLAALRGLHFLEAEKQPEGGVFKPVLDPSGWVRPDSAGAAGEVEVVPANRRKGNILLSLPALLSHIGDALHRGKG